MSAAPETRRTRSADQTRRLGRRFARALQSGDVIALLGEIGAGKTTFVQGVASGLGVPVSVVVSPSFVLMREYHGRLPLYHADLFRLDSMPEAATVGLEECYEAGGVTLVEWANRIPAVMPAEFLEVRFQVEGENERTIEIFPHGPRYERRRWLAKRWPW